MSDLTISRPADIMDHDLMSGNPSAGNWPVAFHPVTLKIHLHFCELIHSWNLNPFRRDMGVAAVDQLAEESGMSRFSFTSKESRDDFLDFYALDSFVMFQHSPEETNTDFFWLTLTNKFPREEANKFFTIYRSVMNNLAIIQDERNRAIHSDGNKVGLICVEHFSMREAHELTKIKAARQALGEGSENSEG